MGRVKIDYGIDLGTTNSALARMESGTPTIRKSEYSKDTIASCVGFNRKKSVVVGDDALTSLQSDILNCLRDGTTSTNFFIEFKRTMGTDKPHKSFHMKRSYSSEELSAEVLKKFRALVVDEEFSSAVITVPAKFSYNQKDATGRAARLAGLMHCELLQEPVAAAMAFGLSGASRDGRWLVFDLGGGTFDAALLRVSEGIIKVEDTEGDNYLGGQNIDYALVDKVLIPHLKDEGFALDRLMKDPSRSLFFRQAIKGWAELAKIRLSFQDNPAEISPDPGRLYEDDNGDEIELDYALTSETLRSVENPFFQKAIGICKSLLERNRLTGDDLTSLILVGGPTWSRNLREMLGEEITENVDTSIDPMIAVAKGAALYASTLDFPESISRAVARARNAIRLEIRYEATTVEDTELVTVKVAENESVIERLFVEFYRTDGGSSTGRIEIGELGELVEVTLMPGRANAFDVSVFDDSGNRLDAEPSQFTIIQGTKPGPATLSYHMMIEVKDSDSGKLVLTSLKGLEKGKSYPATGERSDLKTQEAIGPDSGESFIKIGLFEGDHDAEGTRAVHSDLVYEAQIPGNELPGFLPIGSPVELTVRAESDSKVMMSAYFPTLDHTVEIDVPTATVQKAPEPEWLRTEIIRAGQSIELLEKLGEHVDTAEADKLSEEIDNISRSLDEAPTDYDRRMQVRNNLRLLLRKIDQLEKGASWPYEEARLRDTYQRLREYYDRVKDDIDPDVRDRTETVLDHFKKQVPQVIAEKDRKLAKELTDEMDSFGFAISEQVLGVRLYVHMIREYDDEFDTHEWSDPNKARLLINQGLAMANGEPTREGLRALLRELFTLLPKDDKPVFEGDSRVLER